MKKYIPYFMLFVIFSCQAIEYIPKRPPSLEETVKKSDIIAVFNVTDIEYVIKEITFLDNRINEKGKEYEYVHSSNMLLTKYTIEVNNGLKNSQLGDLYHVYADGGIDGEFILQSSVGFDLRLGDELLIMLEFDDVNMVYFSTLHNSTVFEITESEGLSEIHAKSGMQYYKYENDVMNMMVSPGGLQPDYTNKIYISDIMELINE